MWDKLLFLTLITVFFPWSLLVLLLLFGWDETVRIFRNVVLNTFGPTVITVVTVLMLVIGLVFVALAIFWAYKDIESFLVALVVVGIMIGMRVIGSPSKDADREIRRRQKLGYEKSEANRHNNLTHTIANHDEWHGLLLFEHMKQNGFDDSLFGNGPMMSVVKNPVWGSYESAIVPFEKKFRNNMFQVSRFINLGDMLKFPNEMKFKVPPPLTIASALRSFPEEPVSSIIKAIIAAGFSLFSNMRELNKMSYIEGWVCEYNNPPFSTFPFDQWLRVDAIATTWLDLYDQNGKLWRLGTVVLCDYKQLRILRLQVTGISEKLG